MQCLSPVIVKAKELYIDGFNTQKFPCGRCPACIKKRASHWSFRLRQELKRSISAMFLTLTYADETVPYTEDGKQTLRYKDHQDFMKRLRKNVSLTHPSNPPLKYYAVGEYGEETQRPHFHSILFNVPHGVRHTEEVMNEIWQHGKTDIRKVEAGSIAYVCGYLNKELKLSKGDTRKPAKSFMSKGLGENYLTENIQHYYKKKLHPYLKIEDGLQISMPRYYKEKLYNFEEKAWVKHYAKEHIEENMLDEIQEAEVARVSFQTWSEKNIFRRTKL